MELAVDLFQAFLISGTVCYYLALVFADYRRQYRNKREWIKANWSHFGLRISELFCYASFAGALIFKVDTLLLAVEVAAR